MNTHRVFILTLLLGAAIIKLDSHRLGAAGLFSAATLAAVVAIAYNDSAPRRHGLTEAHGLCFSANHCAVSDEQNSCVLCGGVSS